MSEASPSIVLALHDAATNCARDGATVILTLRSGVTVVGRLEKPTSANPPTVQIKTASTNHVQRGGWATVLTEEIAVVEARA